MPTVDVTRAREEKKSSLWVASVWLVSTLVLSYLSAVSLFVCSAVLSSPCHITHGMLQRLLFSCVLGAGTRDAAQ